MLCCHNSLNKYKRLDTKLEKKMMEVKRSPSGNKNFRSINGIIMRFPQIKEGLKDIRGVFEQCDEDSNGTIDLEELKKCLQKLQLHLTEKELIIFFTRTSKMGSPQLEATFDTIIEAFLFLDKNGDGKLNKKDMVKALKGDSPLEISPAHITRTRFEEMDWERKGKVSFREFLFALINWVGIDADDEILVAES
ncbi:hypothetical protein HYC85_012578 [Camellia sinensis]|uniref:EF-hand domain-containing protein n=1 Tax=Camellia sinensis TaxID=4442 RepID=A0A7J7HD85_CAMSI|nr:hypothetical protein HYC85_012578 [Camellia sinensis]